MGAQECSYPTKTGRQCPGKVVKENLCRRHWNRQEQNCRIEDYVATAPRCPDHPDRTPRVTRWYNQAKPVLSCTAPTGRPVVAKPTGQGVVRTPSKIVYLEYCPWKHEIPGDVLRAK